MRSFGWGGVATPILRTIRVCSLVVACVLSPPPGTAWQMSCFCECYVHLRGPDSLVVNLGEISTGTGRAGDVRGVE